ncbi:aspartate/glutamate racemase family protein [Streptomyces solicathayae]|uniref:Aspartate/glutamate racemase family protein n=1 Tax=Streptomyces solicathayae TaxID=3081768 RepID=A0ABZ0LNZ7_9ACTN|nr:aspartate/glutamate racemase family protein [Streptomyces sp. HUAS YS2]WOX21237.1 aspartate/glutamate racemase family protein [Streptomyces sp. HUAS YS2]
MRTPLSEPVPATVAGTGVVRPVVRSVVLINPNTSKATTAMMTAIASRALGPAGVPVRGVTVARGPRMLTDPAALAAAAPEVVAAGLRAVATGDCAALIVAAFGDPGAAELRARVGVPVVGLAEASLAEAAAGGARFGVATTTPALADAIAARVAELGLADRYTGIRLTEGDPHELSADPESLRERLAEAVRRSLQDDGATRVVIGGGPLGDAAAALRTRFHAPVIAPIPAACRSVLRQLPDDGAGSTG